MKLEKVEEELKKRNDYCRDLERENIMLKKEIEMLRNSQNSKENPEMELKILKEELENSKRENDRLRSNLK